MKPTTPEPGQPQPKQEMSAIGKFLFEQAKQHAEIYRAGMKQDIFKGVRNQFENPINPQP